MRIALIYPPAGIRNSEAFVFPNLTIAALADALAKAGHRPLQRDLDLLWRRRLRARFSKAQLRALLDNRAISAFLKGRPGRHEIYKKTAGLLFTEGEVPEADLYGITLVDMARDPLILNFSALLAWRIQKLRKGRVVIGSNSVSRGAYLDILRNYPVFDYAVYASDGCEALKALAGRLSGGKGGLFGTLEKKGGKVTDHDGAKWSGLAPSMLYAPEIISSYGVSDRRIFSRYNSSGLMTKMLLGGKGRRQFLVLPYAFETTCPGRCAFCAAQSSGKRNAKPVTQVLEELHALKEMGATGVYFINTAFNNSYKTAEAICDGMIRLRLGLLWSDCANMREIDGNLLEKMRRSGAVKLTFGMETGSARLLKYIGKGTTLEKIELNLRRSHGQGIWNHIELIGGLPTETENDIKSTEDFIKSTVEIIDVYSLNPFMFYKKSPFYTRAAHFGLRPVSPAAEKKGLAAGARTGSFFGTFEEIGGLSCDEKKRQIHDSTRRIAETINRHAGSGRIDFDHIHLLMCLYEKLGHRQKPVIKQVMNAITGKFMPYYCDFFVSPFDYIQQQLRPLRTRRQSAEKPCSEGL